MADDLIYLCNDPGCANRGQRHAYCTPIYRDPRDAEIARLRDGIRAAVEGRYERQVSGLDDRYCQHVRLRRSACPHCLDAFLTALLDTPAPEADHA